MAVTDGPIANIKGSSQAAGDKSPQHVLVVDAGGTAVTFGGSGGTSSTDEGAFTAGVTLGTPAMGVYESSPSTLTNGQQGLIGLTADREVKVSVTSGGTSGTQYTEGDTDASIAGTAMMLEGAADAVVAARTGGGAEANALLVTLANNSTGLVSVDDNGSSLTVDNGGTFAVQVDGAALTALQLIDNLVLLEDAAHSSADPGVQALTVRTDTAAARAGTDGDYQPLISDASGRLHVNVGNTITVSGTVTANAGTGTQAVSLASVPSHAVTNAGTFAVQAADGGGSLTVDAPVGTPVFVRLSDGSSAITTLPVSLASVPSHAVTNAGTFVTQENGAALTALQLIDNLVLAEDAAHSSGDPGVMLLGVRTDTPAALAGSTGDYAPLQLDAVGAARVSSPRSASVSSAAQVSQGTTAASVLASNAARKHVTIQNTGTTILKFNMGASDPTATAYHFALAACSVADNGTGGSWSSDVWTGEIRAVSSSSGGTCVISELT